MFKHIVCINYESISDVDDNDRVIKTKESHVNQLRLLKGKGL